MKLKFSAWQTKEGLSLDTNLYKEENTKQVAEFLSSDSNDLEVVVANEIKEDNFYYEFENMGLEMRYMLLDLKKDDSSLRKRFTNWDKVDLFNYIFEFSIVAHLKPGHGFEITDYDAFYGNKGYHFKAHISADYVKRTYGDEYYPRIDIDRLPDDEFAKGVVVEYYRELCMWDREKLRSDSAEMLYLQNSWIESLALKLA